MKIGLAEYCDKRVDFVGWNDPIVTDWELTKSESKFGTSNKNLNLFQTSSSRLSYPTYEP